MNSFQEKQVAFKFRAYPKSSQKDRFEQYFSARRVIWNNAVYMINLYKNYNALLFKQAEQNNEQVAKDKLIYWNHFVEQKILTNQLKSGGQFHWMREQKLNRDTIDMTFTDVKEAVSRELEKKSGERGHLRFKRKGDTQSFTARLKGANKTDVNRVFKQVSENMYELNFPDFSNLKIKIDKGAQKDLVDITSINTITVSKKNGAYYVSIQCKQKRYRLESTQKSIGIDWGVSTALTFSNGEKIEVFSNVVELEKKKAREQKKLSRMIGPVEVIAKQKTQTFKKRDASKNWRQQNEKVNKLSEKIASKRKLAMHEITKQLVEQYDIICIEDLSVKSMLEKAENLSNAQNAGKNKKIQEASFYTFKTMLKYKCDLYQKTLVQVDKYYASSQICFECSHKSGKKALDVRDWTCEKCGAHLDRDVNAAKNIEKEGLKIFQKALDKDLKK